MDLPHAQVLLLVLDIFALGTLLILVFVQVPPCSTHAAWGSGVIFIDGTSAYFPLRPLSHLLDYNCLLDCTMENPKGAPTLLEWNLVPLPHKNLPPPPFWVIPLSLQSSTT